MDSRPGAGRESIPAASRNRSFETAPRDRQIQQLSAVEPEAVAPPAPGGLSTVSVCAPALPTASGLGAHLRVWTYFDTSRDGRSGRFLR